MEHQSIIQSRADVHSSFGARRALAVLALFASLALSAPLHAQAPQPGTPDTGPPTVERAPDREPGATPRDEPPGMLDSGEDDEDDAPGEGCPYFENKLELMV